VNRSASPADWLADVAGLLLGLALWEYAARRREPAA
jgi:VanZ family protein